MFSGMYVLLQSASVYGGLHPVYNPGFRQTLNALWGIPRYDLFERILVVARRKYLRSLLSRIDKGPAMPVELRLLLHCP